jgi:small subunit ribosomal protein S1
MEVRILDADKETEKLIVSEKAAQSEREREVISNLNVGDVIEGEISGVVDFGAFIKFPAKKNVENDTDGEKLEGLVHISELAWQLIEDPRSIVKVGDKAEAKIIGIDADKISLSIRALQKDPWSQVEKKYKAGDTVTGTVHKINHFGAFVYLDKDIHGLAHISEMSESYPGKTLDELIKTGESYSWKILSIEPQEHRMGLVLAKKTKENKKKDSDETAKPKKKKTEKAQDEEAPEGTEAKKDIEKKEKKKKVKEKSALGGKEVKKKTSKKKTE